MIPILFSLLLSLIQHEKYTDREIDYFEHKANGVSTFSFLYHIILVLSTTITFKVHILFYLIIAHSYGLMYTLNVYIITNCMLGLYLTYEYATY